MKNIRALFQSKKDVIFTEQIRTYLVPKIMNINEGQSIRYIKKFQ